MKTELIITLTALFLWAVSTKASESDFIAQSLWGLIDRHNERQVDSVYNSYLDKWNDPLYAIDSTYIFFGMELQIDDTLWTGR